MTRPVVAITIGRSHYRRMFSDAALADLAAAAEIVHHPGDEPASKQDLLGVLADADACITSWGVAPLDAEVVAAAPRLGHMAHMGGSVKRFVSDAVWERGIRVTSAAVTLARSPNAYSRPRPKLLSALMRWMWVASLALNDPMSSQ